MGAPATAVAFSADGQIAGALAIYRGFTVEETTGGAPAVVRIYDGTSNAGLLIESIALAAGESASDWLADGGLRCATGIYVDVVSGTVNGSVRVG